MIEVHDIEVLSDAGPMDDLDPDFAVPVSVVVSVDGEDLARMLRVQKRVLRKRLAKLSPDAALYALLNANRRFRQEMFKTLRTGVRTAIYAWAFNEFDHGARLQTFDWAENASEWGVQIEPKQGFVAFDAVVDVLGIWE